MTGVRGSGKTALVEQLSQRAAAAGRRTIDVGPDDTVHLLTRGLQLHDEESRGTDPQLGVSVLGSGVSVGGVSSTQVTHYDRTDMQLLFLKAAAETRRGIFVSVDEVQKVDPEELSAVCGAFQMASRKGCDVILVLAGLPVSHERVIHYDGCTFMRRAVHEELTLFTWDEAYEALGETFALAKGLVVTDGVLERLTRASYGHPYVMQLLGYYAVERVNEQAERAGLALTDDVAELAIDRAVAAYERRALRPLLQERTPQEVAFLRAMACVLDESRVARVAAIANACGKEQRQLSAARAALIDDGIIISAGRGELMFNVPYFAAFLQKPDGEARNLERVRSWGL